MAVFLFQMPNQSAENEDQEIDLPDLRRNYLSPQQLTQYSAHYPLQELIDTITTPGGLHINICTPKDIKLKVFIGHICMDDGEELNIAYTFITTIPNLNMLMRLIEQDFETYILKLRDTQHDTVH